MNRLLKSPWFYSVLGFVGLLEAASARTTAGRYWEWALAALMAVNVVRTGHGTWWDS